MLDGKSLTWKNIRWSAFFVTLAVVLALVIIFAFAVRGAMAETNDEAYKARIASCHTEGCLLDATVLYFELHRVNQSLATLGFERTEENAHYWERAQRERAEMEAQLRDAELFNMLEDGRWAAKSEAEKRDYAKEHWGAK